MKSLQQYWPQRVFAFLPTRRPRQALILVTALFLSAVFVCFGLQLREGPNWTSLRPWADDVGTVEAAAPPVLGGHATGSPTPSSLPRLHIIIPSSKTDVRLCKNLLSQTILGYPRPNLVFWDQTFDNPNNHRFLGGGSHLGKINSTLHWLENPSNQQYEDDMVIMIDAYDIWFQLPPETLFARYYEMIASENARVAHRMGRAFDAEGISTKVIFSASKRCGPNDIHSVACYPIPESPLPKDIYGNITDVMNVKPESHAGLRQRHLVSGFIMGPFRDMRAVFARANERMNTCLAGKMKEQKFVRAWCHRGSDQSFFNEMFGEQEYHREVMRRRHHTWLDNFLDQFIPNRAGAPRKPLKIEKNLVDDPLNPSFPHQPMHDPDYNPAKPYEFGIMVDHFSQMSHQTSNALHDSAYVVHSNPLAPQLEHQSHGMQPVCRPIAPMPTDIPSAGVLDLLPEGDRPRWEDMPLYSEICAGVVPVIAHHNWYKKWPIEKLWADNWWTGRARALFEARRNMGDRKLVGGADTDTGLSLSWEDLCPAEWDAELFPSPNGAQEAQAAAGVEATVGEKKESRGLDSV
ncbi:hypothetical protein SODALDRAFT_95999 [Sodiomyces alkalinus F11]|uniref:Uncharacterized protein n=1 Tax=Sodiomyces alkalinus (strain CBS 110278 / VKM F-3762 / F11) TaxID=1314773 RepID=A0A3N2Q0W9_SODAK|nr:hypothetical protein SODALDRAFT_95999 [Sodiomyces alkalinus F11]ROT40414.1 hypothetical protein SODALDRAFT_95999 [Sodiomyces alkalinus F11]